MKKLICGLLALMLALGMTACGKTDTIQTDAPTTAPTQEPTVAPTAPAIAESPETILEKLVEQVPVEFYGEVVSIDLTDTSEDGLWRISSYTGLENADDLAEAAVFEPMMGSLPFSMVVVRVNESADVASVAEAMKSGINPRKWVCVEADDLQVAVYGDTILLIMVGSETDYTAQSYVDAFEELYGIEYTLE